MSSQNIMLFLDSTKKAEKLILSAEDKQDLKAGRLGYIASVKDIMKA